MVTVSVVITTFNRAPLLKRAIESVLSQTYVDFELIIIDDSTDNTADIVRRYDDPRICYVQNKIDRGYVFSRNFGISIAKGKYIAFLDDDDEWLPTKLSRQVKLIENSDKSLGAIYSGYTMISEKGRRLVVTPKFKGRIRNELLRFNCVGTPSTVIVKKEVLTEVNGFDEKLQSCEDRDLYLRIAERYKFDYLPESLVNYYITRQSMTMNPAKMIQGQFSIFLKYSDEIPSEAMKSRYYLVLGDALCLNGNMTLGKKYLLYAILGRPAETRRYVHLLMSFLGRRIFCVLYPLMLRVSANYL